MLKIGSYWKKWNPIENYVFKKIWLFCKKKKWKTFCRDYELFDEMWKHVEIRNL